MSNYRVYENNEGIAGVDPVVAKMLRLRGVNTPEDAQVFLNPTYDNLGAPALLHDMNTAVTRILEAIEKEEKICIYADYDADGIPGAVVLSSFFEAISYTNWQVYIPHRHDEGYGFHIPAIDTLASSGVTLIITIDLGIRAVDAVAYASSLGIDVIVTDHHEPGEVLPDAVAVVNPKVGDTYPDPMLCGAAVAWQLVRGLMRKTIQKDIDKKALFPDGWEKWLLDMVGIATVCDMVPLLGENRILATYGLVVIGKTRRPGLRGLMAALRLRSEQVTEEDIGFSIGPRINAASRMSHPIEAYNLFMSKVPQETETLVHHLVECNEQRKKETAKIMRAVHKKLSARELGSVIVIGDLEWNQGVLGLIASKLVDEYNRPVMVWSQNGGGILKGSCRSDQRADLMALMGALPPETLIQFGGHKGAAGFSVSKESIHSLEALLCDAYDTLYPHEGASEETIMLDAECTIGDINKTTYQQIRMLAPFGVANPKPQFILRQVTIISVKQFGAGKQHLEIVVGDRTGPAKKAIAFFAGPESFQEEATAGITVDLVARIELNTWGGASELRLKIIDIL